MIGQTLLNYHIEKLIGEGGMGKVYLAQHNNLNRKVAIKILHPHLIYSPEFRTRFKTEANLLANLQHPNIVTLYDYIENDKLIALIMEYVEGSPLSELIKKKKYFRENELIPIFTQVLNAFQFAHDKGIVHRDIKPANIILTPDQKVKILDFGIAKIMGGLSQTQTGAQIGTVIYMSPEQIKGQKVDYRTDIYSLGVTLYELATGKMAYAPNSSIYEISNAIVHKSLPKPTSINSNISPRLENAILKATEKNPVNRFQSCSEFLIAITPPPKKSFFSSFVNWILIFLLLSALAFLGWQLYQRYFIQNHQLILLDDTDFPKEDTIETSQPEENENSSSNEIIPKSQNSTSDNTSQSSSQSPSNEQIFLKGNNFIKKFLQKLNSQDDFTNMLANEVLVHHKSKELPKLLSSTETYQLLTQYFDLTNVTAENSYEIINSYKIIPENGLVKLENLVFRKEVIDYSLDLVVREYDWKITEIYFKN